MTEQEIRSLLQAKLADSPHGKGAAFVSELFIDSFSRRADLVMANGKLAAFEIKSERDSLDRLDGQLATYLRFFERVTIVCAPKHLTGVQARAQEAVGIWLMKEDGTFKVVRRGSALRQNCRSSWLSFLPVAELRALMVAHGLVQTGTRDVLERRADEISTTAIRSHVIAYFKTRREATIAMREAKRSRIPRATVPTPFAFSTSIEHQTSCIKAIPRFVG